MLVNKVTNFLKTSKFIQQMTVNLSVVTNNQFTPVSIDVPWGKIEGIYKTIN